MSETKFSPPEAITESERLARAKKLKPRNTGRQIEAEKRLVEKQAKHAQRGQDVAQRRREREVRAVEVNAERLTTALARAEEREKAAKEPKADDFESYEVSGGDEVELKKRVNNKHVIRRGEKAVKDLAKDLAGLGEESQEKVKPEVIKQPQKAEIISAKSNEVDDEDIIGVEEVAAPIKVHNQNPEPLSISGETNKNVVSRATHEAEKIKTARTLVEEAVVSPVKKKKPELSPTAIEAIKRSAEAEEAKFVSESQRFAPRKEDEEGKEEENRATKAAKEIQKNRKELFSEALLQAYKEMGEKITKDNEEEFLIKKPPFSYIFSAKGRKVRDLYSRYVKELK